MQIEEQATGMLTSKYNNHTSEGNKDVVAVNIFHTEEKLKIMVLSFLKRKNKLQVVMHLLTLDIYSL